MSLTVEFKNPEEVQKFLLSQANGMKRVAEDAAVTLTFNAGRLAREHARDPGRKPRPITRRYFTSIFEDVQKKGDGNVLGRIGSTDKKAPWFEFGTKPHVIKPRNAQALFWKGARHPVKLVFHPGTPPYKVLAGAAEKTLQNIDRVVAESMRRGFK